MEEGGEGGDDASGDGDSEPPCSAPHRGLSPHGFPASKSREPAPGDNGGRSALPAARRRTKTKKDKKKKKEKKEHTKRRRAESWRLVVTVPPEDGGQGEAAAEVVRLGVWTVRRVANSTGATVRDLVPLDVSDNGTGTRIAPGRPQPRWEEAILSVNNE